MSYKYQPLNTIYKRKWMRDRRAAFLSDKRCKKCGAKKNLVIRWGMQKNKRLNFSAKPKRVLRALSAVDIVCRKHYLEERSKEQRTPLVHGTLRGYKTHKCRCAKCKKASAVYAVRRRADYQVKLKEHVVKRAKALGII